jgi:hypothetical protein
MMKVFIKSELTTPAGEKVCNYLAVRNSGHPSLERRGNFGGLFPKLSYLV